MKVRLRNNSIRLRLTQGEVQVLADAGQVDNQTHFTAGQVLGVTLRASDTNQINADFDAAVVTIGVPRAALAKWCTGNEVSLTGRQTIDDDTALSILVEKDFACLAPRSGDDDDDCFPHPQADSANS